MRPTSRFRYLHVLLPLALPFALPFTVSLAAALSQPSAARAQRSLAYDTLSSETPGAVSCGFCGGEKAAVIYYELPGGGGLRPSEFPLLVRELVVAVASAAPGAGGACVAGTTPREGLFDIAVYAGTTVPTAVNTLPADGVWPGEVEVTAAVEVPLALSISSSATVPMFDVNLLTLELDAAGLRVEAGYTYLRVVLGIQPDAAVTSSTCPAGQGPSGLPMRDDARIGPRRNLIYAGPSAGWLWNEEAGVAGDWAIRLDIRPMGAGADGGAPGDAGSSDDAGSVRDASVEMDASAVDAGIVSPPAESDDGCGCSLVGAARSRPRALVLAALCVTLALCRQRRRLRSLR